MLLSIWFKLISYLKPDVAQLLHLSQPVHVDKEWRGMRNFPSRAAAGKLVLKRSIEHTFIAVKKCKTTNLWFHGWRLFKRFSSSKNVPNSPLRGVGSPWCRACGRCSTPIQGVGFKRHVFTCRILVVHILNWCGKTYNYIYLELFKLFKLLSLHLVCYWLSIKSASQRKACVSV